MRRLKGSLMDLVIETTATLWTIILVLLPFGALIWGVLYLQSKLPSAWFW